MKICIECNLDKPIKCFGSYNKIYKDTKYRYINSRCKECSTKISCLCQKKNPNKLKNNRSWAEKNKEKIKAKNKKYRSANLGKHAANECKRRASKLNQTPKWADLKAIEQFYINCPKGYHVDHIIPLQGKNIRGLHTLDNLQYLPAIENIRKGNRIGV
jgi:hypothetical protein